MVALREGRQLHDAVLGFAALSADIRRFDPVVDRVPDKVHQRVGQVLDHELVELGLLAGKLQIDLLARFLRVLADHLRQAREDLADRHHPDLEDALLEVVQLALEPALRLVQVGARRRQALRRP